MERLGLLLARSEHAESRATDRGAGRISGGLCFHPRVGRPEPFAGVRVGARLGEFRHSITNSRYRFEVREAKAGAVPRAHCWCDEKKLHEIPLSTAARKALAMRRLRGMDAPT